MRSLLLAFFLLFFADAHAQKKLTGRIFSPDSLPVAGANVYLSNTSTGSVSDEKGFFALQNFPEGRFELIISCIGFDVFRTYIRSDQSLDNVVIYLKSKTAELEEVVVKNDPYDKYGWSRYGNFFMENFIGATAFAEQCTLVNKDALRFRYSSKTNVVKITAKEDLIIENNALGYILKYTLVNFEYSLVTKQFIYRGYPFFTEMKTTDKRLEKKWMDNREDAFRGSLLHFMRSVDQNKIKEEQFEVREWVKVTEAEKKRVREMFDRQNSKHVAKTTSVFYKDGKSLYVDEKDTGTIILKDTLSYFHSVMKQIRQEDILIDVLLASNNIASQFDKDSKELTFGNKIEVVYLPKVKYPDYQKTLPADQKFQPIVSNLFNVPDHLVFLPNGSFFGDNIVGVTGYWSWSEKMSNKLPYDYVVRRKE